jgi:hypothetical protein
MTLLRHPSLVHVQCRVSTCTCTCPWQWNPSKRCRHPWKQGHQDTQSAPSSRRGTQMIIGISLKGIVSLLGSHWRDTLYTLERFHCMYIHTWPWSIELTHWSCSLVRNEIANIKIIFPAEIWTPWNVLSFPEDDCKDSTIHNIHDLPRKLLKVIQCGMYYNCVIARALKI